MQQLPIHQYTGVRELLRYFYCTVFKSSTNERYLYFFLDNPILVSTENHFYKLFSIHLVDLTYIHYIPHPDLLL